MKTSPIVLALLGLGAVNAQCAFNQILNTGTNTCEQCPNFQINRNNSCGFATCDYNTSILMQDGTCVPCGTCRVPDPTQLGTKSRCVPSASGACDANGNPLLNTQVSPGVIATPLAQPLLAPQPFVFPQSFAPTFLPQQPIIQQPILQQPVAVAQPVIQQPIVPATTVQHAPTTQYHPTTTTSTTTTQYYETVTVQPNTTTYQTHHTAKPVTTTYYDTTTTAPQGQVHAPVTTVSPTSTSTSPVQTSVAQPIQPVQPVAIAPQPVAIAPQPVAVAPQPVAIAPQPIAQPILAPQPIAQPILAQPLAQPLPYPAQLAPVAGVNGAPRGYDASGRPFYLVESEEDLSDGE